VRTGRIESLYLSPHGATQNKLLDIATAAGWQAELEVRGPRWRADVLCIKEQVCVALEVQLSTDSDLHGRAEYYRDCGVHSIWFMPEKIKNKILRRGDQIQLYTLDEIEAVVPQRLAALARSPLPYIRGDGDNDTCSLCAAKLSEAWTWCWRCRFAVNMDGTLYEPFTHRDHGRCTLNRVLDICRAIRHNEPSGDDAAWPVIEALAPRMCG
jgi:hypothetical protein